MPTLKTAKQLAVSSNKELVSMLLSQKLPLLKRAAKQMRRQRIEGLDQALAEALGFVMTKPRSWELRMS